MKMFAKRPQPGKAHAPEKTQSAAPTARIVNNQALLSLYGVGDKPTPTTRGLPDGLRRRVEAMTGVPLDDVRVTYNSEKPEALGAAAYAKGREIHIAPGEEGCLEHEAGHIVQQSLGLVKATGYRDGEPYNGDPMLEQQASNPESIPAAPTAPPPVSGGVIQCCLDKYLNPSDQESAKDEQYQELMELAGCVNNKSNVVRKKRLIEKAESYLDNSANAAPERRKNVRKMIYSPEISDVLLPYTQTEVFKLTNYQSCLDVSPDLGDKDINPKSIYKNIRELKRLKK